MHSESSRKQLNLECIQKKPSVWVFCDMAVAERSQFRPAGGGESRKMPKFLRATCGLRFVSHDTKCLQQTLDGNLNCF